MKKLVSIAALAVLTACTAPQQASTIGNGAAMYDMNAVQDYNARVTSGNTVTAREKAKVAQRDSVPNEMTKKLTVLEKVRLFFYLSISLK